MCGILSLEWSHAQPIGHKTMDKSCRINGNFRAGNHGMIAVRRAYIAAQNQHSKPVGGTTGRRNVRC